MSAAEVEKKLAQYRAQKHREARYNKYKSDLKAVYNSLFQRKKEDPESKMAIEKEDKEPLLLLEKENLFSKAELERLSEVDPNEEFEDDNPPCTYYDYIYYSLCFTLWATVYAIFVKLQFGSIYFIVSVLIGIYLNTRTGPKRRNEVSAYSVFNKNCESIDGTLKAEDLEKQMLYGGFM